MKRVVMVGVMGPGEHPSPKNLEAATFLGAHIAKQGWILVSGGRPAGVMAACNQAAREHGGVTLGLLPGNQKSDASPHVLLPVPTDLGHGRNALNVLASDVIIACCFGMGAGTLSEIALAMKGEKPLIILTDQNETRTFFKNFGCDSLFLEDSLENSAQTLDDLVKELLNRTNSSLIPMSLQFDATKVEPSL